MKITLISHASVIIKTSDTCIWTDPWITGKAFNESWALFPEAAYSPEILKGIDFIWISHEHPDHFHIPTLRSLPPEFKERVEILFQHNNSDKMFEAFRRYGFKRTRALPHRKRLAISPQTDIYCYHAGNMDSSLAVFNQGETLVNINDCEINSKDCRTIYRDIGKSDIVLNQFSLAGYPGFVNREQHLPIMAKRCIDKAISNHVDLGANVTIPFASYVYFCSEDNRYMNAFVNRPIDMHNAYQEKNLGLAVLYPGDTYDTKEPYNSARALKLFEEAYNRFDQKPIDTPIKVDLDKISAAFKKLTLDLDDRYPRLALRLLNSVVVRIPDIEKTIRFSFAKGTFEDLDLNVEPDLTVYSQPLYFGFSFPFGIQTLGVSARFIVHKNQRNWRKHRILFAMNNAEFYLRPKYAFTRRNLKYFLSRSAGGINQVRHRLAQL